MKWGAKIDIVFLVAVVALVLTTCKISYHASRSSRLRSTTRAGARVYALPSEQELASALYQASRSSRLRSTKRAGARVYALPSEQELASTLLRPE